MLVHLIFALVRLAAAFRLILPGEVGVTCRLELTGIFVNCVCFDPLNTDLILWIFISFEELLEETTGTDRYKFTALVALLDFGNVVTAEVTTGELSNDFDFALPCLTGDVIAATGAILADGIRLTTDEFFTDSTLAPFGTFLLRKI